MNEDARALPAMVQEEKRKEAIRMWKNNRYTHREIGDQVGAHYLTIGRWISRYKTGGMKALLLSKTRGRPVGSGRSLSIEQEAQIQKLLIDKTPEQVKLRYALWTCEAVQQLIVQERGIKLAIRTVGVGQYRKGWGFTVQEPKKKAYEQRPAEVQRWLNEEYPAIHARAKQENSEICWGDETGLRNDCQLARGYAPKGKTPVIELNVKRESINLMSAVTNQGNVRFRFIDGTMNAGLLIDLMKRLIHDSNRKIYLILDNLRVHNAKVVKAWLADRKDEIDVFYLPAYSLELNPDEYLKCDLKAGVHEDAPAHD